MRAEMSYFLSLILLSRLVFTFKDGILPKKDWWKMVGIQSIGAAAFGFRVDVLVFIVLLVLINYLFFRMEVRTKKINQSRLLSLVGLVLLLTVFFSDWIKLAFHPVVVDTLKVLAGYSTLFSSIIGWDMQRGGVIFAGVLLVTNEVNILIRFLFERFKLVPNFGKPTEKNLVRVVNQREYNAGRVIGILERIFVYYFVLNGQLAAIGFILAAKSFARFKDLDQREFAEYVLIGTLLSALLAMLVGGMVLEIANK